LGCSWEKDLYEFWKTDSEQFWEDDSYQGMPSGMPLVTLYQAALAAEDVRRDPAAKAACPSAINGIAEAMP
jgi:hypothetical protein